jgi:glycogen synthase
VCVVKGILQREGYKKNDTNVSYEVERIARVLMFGWEFPPFKSGGLGTACFGLTKGLSRQGAQVTFVLPKAPGEIPKSHVDLLVANKVMSADQVEDFSNVEIEEINSLLKAYITSTEYSTYYLRKNNGSGFLTKAASDDDCGLIYGDDLYTEVYRFAENSKKIVQNRDFDVIHAHDWMTYPAGVLAKKVTGKPLVLHIHATEFDRTAGHPNQMIYDIERQGFIEADMILAVSELTRQIVINNYSISPDKVKVVHNAVEFGSESYQSETFPIKEDDKVVLFLGRITIQKGPDHFIWAAQKVALVNPKVKFVVAGSGDMQERMIEEVAQRGLSDRFIFTGFLKGDDVERVYRMADLYVMPSISEPFGIAPLEAMKCGTPTIISKQSGVSEVLRNCLKVDFWDIDQMANKIIGTLQYKELHETLSENGRDEVCRMTWDIPAQKCIDAYNLLIK